MKFIDEVNIFVSSGHGGAGSVSFRREKFVPKGGPSGGDGGRGGHIYFKTSSANTLYHFRGKKKFQAEHGHGGGGSEMHGKDGQDLYLEVPCGTLVKDKETQTIIADLNEENQTFLLLKGGRGGRGNAFFKSSTNQTPRYAQEGKEGETRELILELKLLADLAIIGLPNAGKSTLISSLSNARPKVADYPFTTLNPQLGVVAYEDKTVTMADIPGLIEGAADGKGLGHKFLKHAQRAYGFIHLIDCASLLDSYEVLENYLTIRNELEQFDPTLLEKRELICLTKIDALTDEEIQKFQEELEEQLQKKVLPISSVSGKNLDKLKHLINNMA